MSLARSSSPPAPQHWRSPLLGELLEIEVPSGRVQCFTRGSGPTIVFAHGWLANANLWRKVVDALADRFRCVTLDLPLGSHRVPCRADADLDAAGVAALVAAALDVLDVRDATV